MIQWDEFYPTVFEVQLATKHFMKSISENYIEIEDGSMSIETAISIAVSEVWTEAKKYQEKKNKALISHNVKTALIE